MNTGGNLVLVNADDEPPRLPAKQMELDTSILRSAAVQLAQTISWVPGARKSRHFRDRCRVLSRALKPLFRAIQSPPSNNMPDGVRLLRENIRLFHGELEGVCETAKLFRKSPQVRTSNGTVIPRTAALAENYLAATAYQFSGASFASYIDGFQETTILNMDELWAMVSILKLVLLEQVVERGQRLFRNPGEAHDLQNVVHSLRDIAQTPWKVVIEPLIVFDRILREDPAETYSRMDYESRDLYRKKLTNIADHSDWTELDVASEAVALAREAGNKPNDDPRVSLRSSHVGTYLLAEGTGLLERRVDFHPPVVQRLRAFLRAYPNEFYLPAIALVTIAIVVAAVVLLTAPSTPLGLILLSALALLLPSSQSAVQIVNYLVTSFLRPEILPKLDFAEGLPNDCITVVAIPTLLLDVKQVQKLVDDLEVRFLGNHDPNLHFALLTDLPDSPTDPDKNDPLVELCSHLISELNEKYAEKDMGSFFLFHRHRVYNPRERLWMGWERKRGKLMDLNKLLRGQFDSFPVKVGNLSILPSIRFVITLDADTELPRGSACRVVGALAHILNQAIIDPERGVVTAGYGILQPRVGVSVQSSASSRLANISSGQTGLDIYTRAASDVYQDLYGEGIFVGKGIYEVDTLHRVLDRRFPRNALLSHDLIEGAYARAGLVSDIEIIEDYPSHYSAYYRRKHRWLRGDWQIAGWLGALVPDEAGQQVSNPLSAISQWKILDNLRRSLVEPALFVLFVLGWICLPGAPLEWTLVALVILFLPALFQVGFELAQAAVRRRQAAIWDALNGFVNACVGDLLTVAFLAHQALLSVDAMVRTMVRRAITRQRLLQWETAAQAQLSGYRRTALDTYLNWTPALALGLFLVVGLLNRNALPVAMPILLLWAFSQPISLWLNRPPRTPRKQVSEKNKWFLRLAALRTWRYFAEFSTEEHNWLIPDNVQGDPARIAPRNSPTNLGFLLNARQVACEFGYLTVPEFAKQTLQTLTTMSRLQRYRGHLLNWYDTRSLAPLDPKFVSTVDSGNLMASLWTLEQACQQLLKRPLLQAELQSGLLDHLYVLMTIGVLPRRKFAALRKTFSRENRQERLLNMPDTILKSIHQPPSRSKYIADAKWFQEQTEERIRQFSQTVQLYAPWLLPKFSALKKDLVIPAQVATKVDLQPDPHPVLEQMPDFIDELGGRLQTAMIRPPLENRKYCVKNYGRCCRPCVLTPRAL